MKDVLKPNYRCATDPYPAWIPTDLPICEIKGTLNPTVANIETEYVDTAYVKNAKVALPLYIRKSEELIGQLKTIEEV